MLEAMDTSEARNRKVVSVEKFDLEIPETAHQISSGSDSSYLSLCIFLFIYLSLCIFVLFCFSFWLLRWINLFIAWSREHFCFVFGKCILNWGLVFSFLINFLHFILHIYMSLMFYIAIVIYIWAAENLNINQQK